MKRSFHFGLAAALSATVPPPVEANPTFRVFL
jgi:hypothetical protein